MKTTKIPDQIDRRTFLQIISVTGLSGLIYPRALFSRHLNGGFSRVAVVQDDAATSGNIIHQNVVNIMVNAGVKTLTQKNNLSDAWKVLLPGLSATSIVALKVNCINSSMPTHPAVTYAVVESLKQIALDQTTFPENNIIIFDRTNGELQSSGYTLNSSSNGVRCFGTNSSGVGHGSKTYDVAGVNQRLSKIVTDICHYLINISVMKNHSTSGVTLCLKNHYGTCHNPGALHGNSADPYIPALNALSPIQSKQKLNICDALFGVKSGGPGGSPQFVANKLILSQDIVAVDYLGRDILKSKGCNSVSWAHHVDTAATNYQLGTNNPAQMEIAGVMNPSTGFNPKEEPATTPDDFQLLQNFPNPFNSQTQIRFYLPTASEVTFEIFDLKGQLVKELIHHPFASGWYTLAWDGRNQAGQAVSSGIYLGQLRAGAFQRAIIMQFLK